MIITTLLALTPVVLALPNAHDAIHQKRTGPTGTVVPNVPVGDKTCYHKGCYDELKSGLHALNHEITSTLTSVTVESCVQGCVAAGYTIAGVMNGNQCFCDNAMSANAPVLDAIQCDLSCSGNPDEVCGGTWHYDIYYCADENTPVPPPTTPPTVGTCEATYKSIGCYVDNTSARTLPDAFSTSDAQTPEACAATCFAQGYDLAGVEWGKECYCGNTLVNPDLAPATDCAQACAGDSTLTCGGEARINVYAQPDDAELPVCSSSSSIPSTLSTPSTTPTSTRSTRTRTGRPRPTNTCKPAPTCGSNDHERYLHQGCYNDNTRSRTLNGYSFSSNSMTPTMCSSKCFSKGYKYAGIEDGDTCYCGNTCPRQQTSLNTCNTPCGGDRKKIGGGGRGTLTVYKSFTLGWGQRFWPSRFW